jgi:16S rRNA (guanine527-N7)-methyltransferase
VSAREELVAGAAALGVALPQGATERLLAHVALIEKWNRVYNLTAVREPARMVAQHLLDSLAVVPHLRPGRLLDVGSGAGLPGLPIAIACPDRPVTLVEVIGKKAAFLRQAVIELGLANVDVVAERVEAWAPPAGYDVVISRAFADIPEFVNVAGRHVAPGGELAAMKGVHPFEELAQLPVAFRLREIVALQVPGLDAQRHLALLDRA